MATLVRATEGQCPKCGSRHYQSEKHPGGIMLTCLCGAAQYLNERGRPFVADGIVVGEQLWQDPGSRQRILTYASCTSFTLFRQNVGFSIRGGIEWHYENPAMPVRVAVYHVPRKARANYRNRILWVELAPGLTAEEYERVGVAAKLRQVIREALLQIHGEDSFQPNQQYELEPWGRSLGMV